MRPQEPNSPVDNGGEADDEYAAASDGHVGEADAVDAVAARWTMRAQEFRRHIERVCHNNVVCPSVPAFLCDTIQ